MLSVRQEIVGREEELAALADVVDDIERQPGHALLEGEPGIGKTVLWREALDRAAAAGVLVLATSPVEPEAPLAFSGLRDLLDNVYDEIADALPAPQRVALDVALLRAGLGGGPQDQGAVAAAFLASLRTLAGNSPVLLAVDDLQWLDGPSRFVVMFAARRLRDEPIALLVSLRVGSRDADVPPRRGELRRITLAPLSVGALHRIIRTRLGTSTSRPALVRVHELSGGNPFFALEIARALGRRAVDDAREALRLPTRLQDVVGERLATLPRPTLEALQVASALSNPTFGLVTQAIGDAGHLLDPAVAADVVSLEGDRIRFTHPLLATGAYASAGPGRRRDIHARLADVVSDPAEEARHLALAATGPDEAVAAALEQAANRARASGAPAVAAELAQQAVDLTPAEGASDRLRRAMTAAGSLFDAGDAVGAAKLFARAVDAAPPGPARAEALTGLGRAYGYAADLREAARIYEQAAAESEASSRTRAEAEHGFAVALMRLLEDLDRAVRHALNAVEIAVERGDRPAVAEFTASLALIERLRGQERREYAALDEADAGPPQDRPRFLATLYGHEFMSSVQAVFADDLAAAQAGLERAATQAADAGDEASLPLLLRYLSFVQLLSGDWTQAEKLADEGYEAALLTGQRSQQAVLAATRSMIAAHRGDVEATRRDADEALALVEETGSGFAELLAGSALGLLDLSLGDAEGATRRLEPLLERLQTAGVGEPGVMRFIPDLIEARLRLGRSDDASSLLASYEERAVRLDRPSALAATARCQAMLAAETDLEVALAALDEALAAHARAPMPFERARTLLVRGGVERRARRKRAAREALDEALATFEQVGAGRFVQLARAELGRIGGRAPSPDRLTPTERRVARLVAQGRSTKEVAASLFVSPKTVDGHLSRIYAKLGVHSRTALANELSDLS